MRRGGALMLLGYGLGDMQSMVLIGALNMMGCRARNSPTHARPGSKNTESQVSQGAGGEFRSHAICPRSGHHMQVMTFEILSYSKSSSRRRPGSSVLC